MHTLVEFHMVKVRFVARELISLFRHLGHRVRGLGHGKSCQLPCVTIAHCVSLVSRFRRAGANHEFGLLSDLLKVTLAFPPTIAKITASKMDISEVIHDLQPLRGQVTPIRTIQETKPVEEFGMYALKCVAFHLNLAYRSTGDAYVVEVNVKAASKVVK